MENNSVPIFKATSPISYVTLSSPGNNPFDDLLQKTIDTTVMSEWKNLRAALQLSGNFIDVDRQSLSFHELNTDNIGRESIGILPSDFGRDSLGFMNISSSEIGRESLGILQINELREFSFRGDNLALLNLTDFGKESLDCGRESLGILHIKSPDVKFGDEDLKIPNIILTTIEENSNYVCNPLDTAFLNSNSRKLSATSSTTSSRTPSFNSASLEGPSMIYSTSLKQTEDTFDLLNKAFINVDEYSNLLFSSISSVHSPINRGKHCSRDLFHLRSRIQSLPVTSEKKIKHLNSIRGSEFMERKSWTTNTTMKTKTIERKSFHEVLDFEDTNDFADSVFIEGHHIAEKIADGSILNDLSGNEIGILDCTPQPIWPEDLSFNEKEKEGKCDMETVFKTVDKMLQPSIQDNKFKLKVSKTDNNSSNENNTNKITNSQSTRNNKNKSFIKNEANDSKLIQTVLNITCDSDKQSTCHKNNSVSRDTKEILQNLSEILNCTHRSDQQRSEGQNLLSSLADILCENNSNTKPDDPNDSGHSSINENSESPKKDSYNYFEVLDLRTKSVSDYVANMATSKNSALDLSLKSKSKEIKMDPRLTKSCSSKKNIPLKEIKKKNVSTLGLGINKNKSMPVKPHVISNEDKNVNSTSRLSVAGKLRPKAVTQNTKKGPMKAVIPVGDMKRRSHLAVTPERTQQKSLVMMSRRTSTPIQEAKIRPMAASTPSGHPERAQKETPNSPLQNIKTTDPGSNSRTDRASTRTSCLPRTLNKESKLYRRNSVSEIKKTETVGRTKRSNSIENETGIMSSLAKVRQNIINSPYYQLKNQNTLREKNTTGTENKVQLERNKGIPVGKSCISKLRTPGKENLGK